MLLVCQRLTPSVSTGYPPAVRPPTGDAARPLCDGRNQIKTGSGASCVRSWVAVSSVAHHARGFHHLLPTLIAVQPSTFQAFIASPLGCRICSTALLVCPVSMSAPASWITVGGSCRMRHAIGHVLARESAIKRSSKACTSLEYRQCERPFPPTASLPSRPPHAGPPARGVPARQPAACRTAPSAHAALLGSNGWEGMFSMWRWHAIAVTRGLDLTPGETRSGS